MAGKMKAINAYRPRIKRGKIAEVKEAANLLARRTGLNKSAVYVTLLELRFLAGFFLKSGRSLRLPGIGLLSPQISFFKGQSN